MKPYIHFLPHLVQFFLEFEIFSKTSRRENRKTHFVFNKVFPKMLPFEIMWKHMVQPGMPQGKI